MKNNEQPIDSSLLDDVFSKYQKVVMSLFSGVKGEPIEQQNQEVHWSKNEYRLGLWWLAPECNEPNEQPEQQPRHQRQ